MPLIGAQGPGSNISWRGNLDEFPDFFQFPQIVEVDVGIAVTSLPQTITGINYKALVTAVGSGASVSVNGGAFVDGNDPNNPIIIRNDDIIAIQIRTQDTDSIFDFNKVYNVDVTVGKRDASWLVRTKRLDDTPDVFSFTDSFNNEVSTLITSDEVTVTGIDGDIGVDLFVKSPSGVLFVNGVNRGRSTKILNNDTLYLQNTTSGFYETNTVTSIQLGTFDTNWTIGTRVANKNVNAFDLGSVSDVDPNTIQISNTITISGPDPNINGNNPLEASIIGADAEFRVVRDGQEVRGYSPEPFTVQTGDQITVKAVASTDFDTTIAATLTINETIGSFSIETRPTPIKTFPDQFNFVDKVDVERTSTLTPPENRIDSDPIILTGMTEAPDDFGTASITGTGGDGSAAQFRVVRDGETVRDFSSANFQVRNGDEITLRIISSPNSLGSVQAIFTINGIDTNNVIAGVPGLTSDTWIVTSAQRFCTITTFSFEEETEATPDVTYSRSFVAEGFDKDCGCVVTTSDTANSFLRIGDREGSSLDVSLGETVEIFLICPYFDSTRTTTVTLTSSFNTQQSADFKITPKAPPLPELTIDANPRNPEFIFPNGGSTVLTFTYDFVTNPVVISNFGVTSVETPRGSEDVSRTNLLESVTYSITVSNSTGSTTKEVQVLVGDPPTPTISLCPSNTSTCASKTNVKFGDDVTLFWKSTFATSVTSTDFTTGNLQEGSVTLSPRQDNRVYSITATGPGGTVTATQEINLTPRVKFDLQPEKIFNGQSATLSWSSDLATRVRSSSGFFASGPNGSIPVNPTVSTTYSITVEDNEGFTDTDTIRLQVEDDEEVDSFFFLPGAFVEQERGSNVVSQPFFSLGGNSVSGLSPGVSVNATVSGVGARFESGGTSKSVQNGFPASGLRVQLTNSSNQDEERTATLDINGVTASFTSRTKACVVNNTTGSIDGLITIDLRQAKGYNSFLGYGISGGNSTIQRQAGTGGEQVFTFSGNFTVPPLIRSVTVEAIGGGGGGLSGRDCAGGLVGRAGGGGGASRTVVSTTPGQNFDFTVGNGGSGGTQSTSTTTTETRTISGSFTQSGCRGRSSGDSSDIIIENCGSGTESTDNRTCRTSTSQRHYTILFRETYSSVNRFDITQFNRSTAGGVFDSGISIRGTSRVGSFSATSGYKVWFCRSPGNEVNTGNTHISGFSWQAVVQTNSSSTTQGTPAGPGGGTVVRYNGSQVLSVGGGQAARSNAPGAGGTPNGGSGSNLGGGGGAGQLSGGTNPAGTQYQGGIGESFDGSSTDGSFGSGFGCSVTGGTGGAYGGGGGAGGGTGGIGGSGAGGAVRFFWEAPQVDTVTYAQLVTEIFRAYWSKGSRGPTLPEIQAEVNKFKNDAATYPTITSLTDSIQVSFLGPTPPVDNCDEPIPQFP